MKIAEAVDFAQAITPRASVPIHEAMLASPPFVYGLLERFTSSAGAFTPLEKGKATEV